MGEEGIPGDISSSIAILTEKLKETGRKVVDEAVLNVKSNLEGVL
jgi:hypothetical protein